MNEQVSLKTNNNKVSSIEINSFCTGCQICVEMCPKDVLSMVDEPSKVSGQVAFVKNLEACNKCLLCEIHCPDFAIKVS